MYFRLALICTLSIVSLSLRAQEYRWQQRVEYDMDVRLDVKTHKVTGQQKLTYYNNSPDTLTRVYYHLFFNAFQPGSMMDVRSRTIADPDGRVLDRIAGLSANEIGYHHINSLKQDGKDVSYLINGTILEVTLTKPILPKGKAVFDMSFESQVPVQIRRSGRDSKEGIAYSMTQWYPKMAEYDYQGWHPYQYVAREFHGVWGTYDVTISIDPTYVVAGTGVLRNPEKVGHGYEAPGMNVKRPAGDLEWHFVAENVHDFAWAADPDYAHDKIQVPGGPEVHFFYQPGPKTTDNWKRLQEVTGAHFQFMNKTFGKYPYTTYSVIQGGDGGMEYPMCTLITGERSFGSLAGVMAHEVSHSWYQGVLASNEALYPWLDEGFTDFVANESMASIFQGENAHAGSYRSYFALVRSGLQEPASEHSDHYSTNRAYSTASYGMGAIMLHQLKYIIGEETFYKGMRRYFETWKFRHPEPNDFIRVMEKVSGMQLHWYLRYWINTTKRIDYGISAVVSTDDGTLVTLERVGDFPMPIDLVVTLKDGTREIYYVPMNEMLGSKPVEDRNIQRYDLPAWPWVNPTYTLKINHAVDQIGSVEIDPSERMADIDRDNNTLRLDELKPYRRKDQ